MPLQAQRHITLQHIIDRVAEVALLTDALSVPKSQQRHLAVLAAGKGHAHHAPRLDGDEFAQSRRLLNRQIAENVHFRASFRVLKVNISHFLVGRHCRGNQTGSNR